MNKEAELTLRLDALELFLQQLLFELEGTGKLTQESFIDTLQIARRRMRETGSVSPETLVALGELSERVLGV